MNNSHLFRHIACVLILYMSFIVAFAQDGKIRIIEEKDTSTVHSLDEVVVTTSTSTKETRATAPLQILSGEALDGLNAIQVADAVKHFSGVMVKDYGGIGGLKTVSVRSLGASHTAVSYDGIAVSDAQNGQIDISRFSLDNIDMLSLSNGQSDQIFQPARQYASAAVLNIITMAPRFDNRLVNGKVMMKSGSFGLINPSLHIAGKLNEYLSMTASGEWMSAHGRYPYLMHYGTQANDSTSIEIRQNTDVQNLRAEAALYGSDSVQNGYLKGYYYQSERGLPGATIFYNTQNFSSQRIWDRSAFLQGHYERNFANILSLQLNAKYNYSFTHYLDPMYLGSEGKDENRYSQNEYYLSGAVIYRPISGLSFNLSQDGIINTLSADLDNFTSPTRYTSLTAVAGKYVNNWVMATASVLMTATKDVMADHSLGQQRFKASPYASLSFKPFSNTDFRIRLFYKNIFRLPTFNDLYYGKVGNRDLLPETTNQYNIGLTFQRSITEYIPMLALSCDIYHNDVRNKIVAYPTKNIYTWTMLNYGRVSITGLDFTGDIEIAPCKEVQITLGATYTYNRALNVTDPTDRDYRHQIPYTPRISGSGKAGIKTPWFTLNYSLIWSGHRYAVNQNYAENRVEGYFDHSLSASHEFSLRHDHKLGINLECLNLTNINYCVVRYFPMPGRSWRGTIYWKF
ncbi:MAG: TonB-dependent receptor plug domain-containing protein [Paludibacteraceae bacterium]|nr:TonB-dependent receptor plug domain-containing protein [Paludibacteraceae bacterium]